MKLHGPFRTDDYGCKIYGTDKDGHGWNQVLDIRGWGYLTGRGSGALGLSEKEAIAEQIKFANWAVDALNAAWERDGARAALQSEEAGAK